MSSKKNLLTIILIVLITLNLATLLGIFFWRTQPATAPTCSDFQRRINTSEYLKKELNLSGSQCQQMDKLKIAHRDTVGFWAAKMRQKRDFINMEMMKTTPNDSLLNAACDEIGTIYATIRKLNIHHYRDMKNLCNEEQKKKLDTVFKDIFCCDDPMFNRFDRARHDGCGMHGDRRHGGCGMNNGE